MTRENYDYLANVYVHNLGKGQVAFSETIKKEVYESTKVCCKRPAAYLLCTMREQVPYYPGNWDPIVETTKNRSQDNCSDHRMM